MAAWSPRPVAAASAGRRDDGGRRQMHGKRRRMRVARRILGRTLVRVVVNMSTTVNCAALTRESERRVGVSPQESTSGAG
jgi:hypothetical protein